MACDDPAINNWCAVMADTVGVAYRAFSARPTWLGGSGKATVDPWTKNLLKTCETAQLIKAGANPTDAAAQAESDVNDSLQYNCADPCKPAKPPMSLTTLIVLVVASAIVLIVATNVFAHKIVD